MVGRRWVWLAGGIYGCGYQEVGVVSRRRVWLAGGMYGCGYQEVEKSPIFSIGGMQSATRVPAMDTQSTQRRPGLSFDNTGVQITTKGRTHLGAPLGSKSFSDKRITNKVDEWATTIKKLSKIVLTQPQVAYAAFTHGPASQWTFILHTCPITTNLLQPLEEAINLHFIPALMGRGNISEQERDLFTLPTRLGGLGIPKPIDIVPDEYIHSQQIAAPLNTLDHPSAATLQQTCYGRSNAKEEKSSSHQTPTPSHRSHSSESKPQPPPTTSDDLSQ